jgi:hypothetical protein
MAAIVEEKNVSSVVHVLSLDLKTFSSKPQSEENLIIAIILQQQQWEKKRKKNFSNYVIVYGSFTAQMSAS